MQAVTRSRQPRPEARVAFDLLMEVFDGKDRLDENAIYERVCRFVTVVQRATTEMVRWKWTFNAAEQKEIAKWLQLGLERLRSGQTLQYSSEPESSPLGIIWDPGRSAVCRAPSIHLKNMFFDLVVDLLIEVGPWLKTCQREGCNRFFLYRRPNQAFCSESCAQRVRTARFVDQRRVKSSKTRSRPSRRRRQPRAAKGR